MSKREYRGVPGECPWRSTKNHSRRPWEVLPGTKASRYQARQRAKITDELRLMVCMRVLTACLRRQIDAGKTIYCLKSRKTEDARWINSVGIWKTVADDFQGYPIALLTTITAFKYSPEYQKVPYELTERQWRGLYSRCSLYNTFGGE